VKSALLVRSLYWVLSLLLLALALPSRAYSQPQAPDSQDLTSDVRERISQAAADTLLPPWQRDFMLRLARGGDPSTPDSAAARARALLPERALTAADGAWAELPSFALTGQRAILDPVRERMVVFGGWDGSGWRNDVWALSLAGTPTWTLLTSDWPPSARGYHSAIYDSARDRMVVFGGWTGAGDSNDVWALSLAGTPAWTELMPYGTPPSERSDHSAIYDPVRDRMVVFGGHSGSILNDVWALSLAGTPAWTQLTPSGTPPSGRAGHSAIYDPLRDRMVVFGGYSGSTLNDVWALSLAGTPAWTQLTPSGTPPSARYLHSTIYDPVRDRMMVFGGYSGSLTNDVWVLSLAGTLAWTQLTPSGIPPIARYEHSAIYDPVRDRMVVFGGYSGSVLKDVWALSFADMPAWAMLTTDTPPSPRHSHTAICDPVRDRMVVFGGNDGSGGHNEVWALGLGTSIWAGLMPTGTPPSPRHAHTAIYDPMRARMVVFGGWGGSGFLNDIWALSLAGTPAWTALTPAGTPPSQRQSHSAIYDWRRERMVVFGGCDGSGYRNDVWVLSLAGTPEWTPLTPTGMVPGARWRHSAIYDPVRDRMVVFGGLDGSAYRNDVWALALAGTPAWSELMPGGAPPSARCDHNAIYDPVRDRMVVFGGYAYDGVDRHFNDVKALQLTGTAVWTELSPGGPPPSERRSHGAIYDPARDRMVVFGGSGASGFRNDAWALWWGAPAGIGDPEAHPPVCYLRPPAPNPSSGTTAMTYSIAQAGRVQLGVYDASGRLMRRLVDGERRAGAETVVWNGTSESGSRLEPGVYFVRLAGPGTQMTRKIVLLR